MQLRRPVRLAGGCAGSSQLGDLAETTGTLAFDADTHDDARQVFSFALGCAEQAEDWHLRATVLSTMAVPAIRTGRPDEALTLAELALVRADDRHAATHQDISEVAHLRHQISTLVLSA
ncbi:MAG: hypothetical protein ACRDQX_16395 [Pseudonocardiaceae bacterium]